MISAYLDELKDISDVCETANSLSLKRIPLRNINDKNLYNLNKEELIEVKNTLKDSKIRVSLIDINVKYDLYNVIDISKISEISKELVSKDVVIEMPTFTNFEAEKTQLVIVIKDLISSFKKEKMELNFHVDYSINSGYIAYLLKEVKDIRFIFSPGDCYNHDKSITTYYRLLRKNITNIIVYDLDESKKPVLIGYGRALILDIIDKLNKDKFRGDLYYDFNLSDYVASKNKNKEPGFFKRIFTRKSLKSHQQIDEKLRIIDDKEVDFTSLLKSQLQLLNKYQRI